MRRLKVLIFVESDVTIRHFLLNDTFLRLQETCDCVVVLPPVGWKRILNGRERIPDRFRVLNVALPDDRRKLWQKMVAIDQMRPPTRLDSFRLWRARFAFWGLKPAAVYAILAIPGIRGIAERVIKRWMDKAPPVELDELVVRELPDILIHPSTFDGYFINDVVELGRRKKIPSLLVMNSWDNPSVKRAAAGLPDWIAVWGEQTRIHCIEMMRADEKRVRKLGAAQFDLFKDPPSIDRPAFRREHDLNDNAIVVLYAGSSQDFDEADHLDFLNSAIEAGALPAIHIVYRPHPYGIKAERAQRILGGVWAHVSVEATMVSFLRRVADGNQRGFHITDYMRTHDILSSVDAVISPLSTILIEAALHGRPVLCYFPVQSEAEVSLWQSRLRHFDEIFEHELTLVARSKNELLSLAQELCRQIGNVEKSREIKKKASFFVDASNVRYPERLSQMVLDILEKRAS